MSGPLSLVDDVDRLYLVPSSNQHEQPSSRSNASITSSLIDAARVTDWNAVLALSRSHPQSAAYLSSEGLTTLHLACSRRCSDPSVFSALIQAYPNALQICDEKGWTPLHHAARFKAPFEAVELLLQMHPEMGRWSASQKCNKGRTALYYALRYDAPDGVVPLILSCMDQGEILGDGNESTSTLAMVWDRWANSLEGKKVLGQCFKKLDVHLTMDERILEAQRLRESLRKGSKLMRTWEKAELLLMAAFGFSPNDLESGDEEYNDEINNVEENLVHLSSDHDSPGSKKGLRRRRWRVLHATASIPCHHTLFRLACVLHPEQACEIDSNDLSEDDQSNQWTALHLAAKSSTTNRDRSSKSIISTLLQLYPHAASIQNPIDNSLPLHYLCKNETKSHWIHDDFEEIYQAFPKAVQWQDHSGRTPLHLAAITFASKQIFDSQQISSIPSTQRINEDGNDEQDEQQHVPTPAPLDEIGSICHNLIRIYPESARAPDINGQLPLHLIASFAVSWNDTIQTLLDAYPAVMHIRASGQKCFSQCPVHMVCVNPNARECLVENIVQNYRRGAMLVDANGNLPFHLAIESGKTWEGGLQVIHDAYQLAIETRENNSHRQWLPLHCAIASPKSSSNLIETLLELYPQAIKQVDGFARTSLHLAVESGKDWESRINCIFQKYPDAILKYDSEMRSPLMTAALKFCQHSDGEDLERVNDEQEVDLRLSQVNVMFQLLKAAPHIIQDNES